LASRVSLIIPKKLPAELESLSALTGEDKSTLMRRLMLKGLEELKLDMGVDMYVKGKTSLERSARVAGVSVWRFLDELTERKIGMRYKLEDAQEEIERIVSRHVKA
jgi:predicted HTH domain antitoxin